MSGGNVTGMTGGKARTVFAAHTINGGAGNTVAPNNGGRSVSQSTNGSQDAVSLAGVEARDINIHHRSGEGQQQRSDVKEDEEPYTMKADPRGLCYIFNNKKIEGGKSRLGTDRDRDNLKRVFNKMKFMVEPFDDKDSDEMEKEIKKLSEMNHAKYDCVVVFVLSHGKEGVVKGADNFPLKINSITSLFKDGVCPSLKNKPKLFFFQSCRGKRYQTASDVASDGIDGAAGGVEEKKPVTPDGDFYIGYSTLSGTKSMRNVELGSWYIQELVDVFDKFAETEDLLKMMTKVKGRVREHKAELEDGSYITQSAESVDSLAKPLYF